jgi:hypothetical protein
LTAKWWDLLLAFKIFMVVNAIQDGIIEWAWDCCLTNMWFLTSRIASSGLDLHKPRLKKRTEKSARTFSGLLPHYVWPIGSHTGLCSMTWRSWRSCVLHLSRTITSSSNLFDNSVPSIN